jgi:hypothetical protein
MIKETPRTLTTSVILRYMLRFEQIITRKIYHWKFLTKKRVVPVHAMKAYGGMEV